MRLGGGSPILASTRPAREQKAYSAPAAGHDRACSAYGYAVAVLPVVEPAPQSYHYRLCQTESGHKGFNPRLTQRFVAKMTRFADVPMVLWCRDAWSILGSPKGKRTQREPKKFSGGGIGDTMDSGWQAPRTVTPEQVGGDDERMASDGPSHDKRNRGATSPERAPIPPPRDRRRAAVRRPRGRAAAVRRDGWRAIRP